jgi:hypothetical protein
MKLKNYNTTLLLLTVAEFGLAALILFGCGWIIYSNTSESSPEHITLLRSKFMPSMHGALRPELRERQTYIGLVLLSVPICTTIIFLRKFLVSVPRHTHTKLLSVVAFLLNILILVLSILCLYQPWVKPQLMYILFDPVWDYPWLLVLTSLLSFFGIYALFKFRFNRLKRVVYLPLLLLLPLLQVMSCRIYFPELVDQKVPFHANIIAYALSQAAAGHTDYHQYGFYARMLAPFFKFNSTTLFNISLLMGLLFIVSSFAIYRTLSGIVKNQIAVPAFALLFFLSSGTWSFLDAGKAQVSIDPYFAYYPIRFLFPALMVLFFYLHAAYKEKYLIAICGLLGGVSLWWNFDSGVATAGAASATMFLQVIFSRKRFADTIRFGIFLIAMSISFFLLLLIFSIQQGGIISPAESLKYVELFSRSGYMMLPLPGFPSPWFLIAGLYLLGIIISLRGLISGKSTVFHKMSLFLAILGIGLFTYYQGRSHLFNLPPVIWPALLLLFIFSDRLLRMLRCGLLNGSFKLALLPTVFLTFCALATIIKGGNILEMGVMRTCRGVLNPTRSNLVDRNTAFIIENAGECRSVNIISFMQGVYYAETGLRAGISDFDMVEIFFLEDWLKIVNELRKAQVPLFIERTHVAPWLYKVYKLKAVSQDGSLLCFLPRNSANYKQKTSGATY